MARTAIAGEHRTAGTVKKFARALEGREAARIWLR